MTMTTISNTIETADTPTSATIIPESIPFFPVLILFDSVVFPSSDDVVSVDFVVAFIVDDVFAGDCVVDFSTVVVSVVFAGDCVVSVTTVDVAVVDVAVDDDDVIENVVSGRADVDDADDDAVDVVGDVDGSVVEDVIETFVVVTTVVVVIGKNSGKRLFGLKGSTNK